MKSLLIISNWLAVPCRYIAQFCGWLLLLLAAVIIYDVVGRRYFSTGSFKLQELQWHLHGVAAMLCFGWTYINNAHVRIDLFSASMSRNTKLRLEIVAILLFLVPFMVALAWFGYDFAYRSFVRGEGSPGGLGLPSRWIIKSMVPLGALLTLVGALSVLLRVIVALRRPDLMSTPWEARR